MAGAIVPLGERVLGSVGKAVTNDIIVLNGQIFRRVVVQKARRKSKKYPQGQKEIVQLAPIDLELHVNPLAIGLGALGVAVAGFFAFGRLEIPLPLGGSLRLYNGPLADEWDAWKVERKAVKPLPPGTQSECALMLQNYENHLARDDIAGAQNIREIAAARKCAWAL